MSGKAYWTTITVAAICAAISCSAARAEVITGTNGTVLDTDAAGAWFAANPEVDDHLQLHVSYQREIDPAEGMTGRVIAAHTDGRIYSAYSWYGVKDKVYQSVNWGPWKWTVSPKPVDGQPDRCTTIAVSTKKYRVKNRVLSCTTAANAVKTYISTKKAPRGFRCATTAISRECQNTSVPNDNAAAYPILTPEEQRLQNAWNNRLFLCGTSDSFVDVRVYAEKYETCEELGDVNKAAAQWGLVSGIVGLSPLPDQDTAFIESPVGGSCHGGLHVLTCGTPEDCITLLARVDAGTADGVAVDTWRYGRFAHKRADYRSC